MAGKKGMKWYAVEFREQVLKERSTGASIGALSLKYDIEISIIKRWDRWKRENGVPRQVTNKIRKGRPKKIIETDKQKIARLEMEVAVLKKSLATTSI